jgi:hypothetical protein
MNIKTFIVAIIVTVSIADLKAQEFYAGPQLGITFTQVDGDSYEGFNKVGLVAGGFVGRKLSRNWDLQLEMMYIQKGSRKTPDAENGDYDDYLLKLNYMHFPLVGIFHYKKFSFEAGLSYGRLLSSTEESEGAPIPESSQVPFKNDEWASIIGFSYHINDKLWVNTRFTYSVFLVREPFNGEIPVYNPHWGKPVGQYNDGITISLYYNLFQKM